MNKALIKKTAVISGILLFCAALLLIYFFAVLPPRKAGEKRVTLEIKYSDKSYVYADLSTETQTVYEFLTEQNDKHDLMLVCENSGYGPFLTSLKGTAQNDSKGYYYTFKINGESSEFGISSAAIDHGDVITFEYGHTTYGDDWQIISYELMPSDAGGTGEVYSYKDPAQIAVIVVCSIAAAAALGVVLFLTLKKDKAQN